MSMLLVLWWIGAAQAASLVPSWPDSPVRYHLETLIETPRSYLHVGRNNLQSRATRHGVRADVTCRGSLDKKRWGVDCSLDEVAFGGHAPGDDAEALKAIFAQYKEMLSGASVSLTITDTGRVSAMKLVGPTKSDARTGQMLETLHLFLRRLFSPLDLQLPKNGDDKGKKWRHRGAPMALELLTRYGTAGGIVLEHQVTGRTDALVDVSSSGRGSVTSGDTLEAGAGSLMRIESTGRGQLDSASGLIVWREIATQAKYTVSAYDTGSQRRDYAHTAWAGRIGEDGDVVTPPPATDP